MLLRRFVTPGLAINSYLLCDELSKKGVVIDPVRQSDLYIARALQDDIEITDIIETHVHADFLSGALDLKQALKNKPLIHCSAMGGDNWIPSYANHYVKDKEEILIGSLRLQAIHTPGHTPEHMIWVVYDTLRNESVPELAFTGDLLFVGGVGRPDLLGMEWQDGLIKQLYHSLFETLFSLPDYVEIFPAHGAGSLCGKEISLRETSTIGYEKKCSPALSIKPFEIWKEQLLQDLPVTPHYFHRIKQMNLKGIQTIPQNLPIFLNENELIHSAKKCLLVDTRNPDAFINHYEGSINIPFGRSFSISAAIAIPADEPLVLIVETASNAIQIIKALSIIGIDRIEGIFTADQWKESKTPLKVLPMIDVKTLHKDISKYFILDVRSPGEWRNGHINEAHHIDAANVLDSLEKLPKEHPLAVICRVGTRSSMITSLLAKHAGCQPINVLGGMQAWVQADLPIVTLNLKGA